MDAEPATQIQLYNQSMPKLIVIPCPACGAKNAVDEEANRFTCAFCGKEQALDGSPIPVQSLAPAEEPPPGIPQPAEIITDSDGNSCHLERRWFSRTTVGLAVFCVFWDGFLILWYLIAVFSKSGKEMFLGPIAHVFIGIILTYITLAGFVNRTVISFDRQNLTVRHRPLPWWGNRTIPMREIDQIFTRKSNVKVNNAPTYDLCYIQSGAKKPKKLLSGLDSPDTARFIEQQVENWLNITDRPVPGE